MTPTRNVAVLVGSLRQASLNRKMARALTKLAPPSLQLEIVEIRELPLYAARRADQGVSSSIRTVSA